MKRNVWLGVYALGVAALLIFVLTGCATPQPPEPVIRTVTVEVPIAVHCRPDVGAEPDYADVTTAPDMFQAVARLRANFILATARIGVLHTALKGCRGE